MSIDPLTEEYEDYTPYQFASNQPVHANEVEGLESSHDLNKRPVIREMVPTRNDAVSNSNSQMARRVALDVKAPMPKKAPTTQGATLSRGPTKEQSKANAARAAEVAKIRDAVENHDNLGNPQTATKWVAKPAFFALGFAAGGAAKAVGTAVEGTVVIGEGMQGVTSVANTLRTAGFQGVETFEASSAALAEWSALTSSGARVSDKIVKGTKLFKENQTWIQGVKNSGKNILDIGSDGRAVQSTFYQMEKQVIYGIK